MQIELTEAEANQLMRALGELPIKTGIGPLFQKIGVQLIAQQKAKNATRSQHNEAGSG